MRIDAERARRLVASQFPQWAHLPVEPVQPGGVDHRTFRLGDAMSVRMPSHAVYAPQVAKEQRWLPLLAAQLPLAVPRPLAQGRPGCGYALPWSVYGWLEGVPADRDGAGDSVALAHALGDFLVALRGVDAAGGPPAGAHSFGRGGPLAAYDADARRAIAALGDEIPTDAVTQVWDAALATEWPAPPVWFHGDVAAGNLLVDDGRLVAVIDFGCCGVGDPACDAAVAWTLFTAGAREAFRARLGLDESTWARGRGWALWKALITLADADAPEPRRVIAEIVSHR